MVDTMIGMFGALVGLSSAAVLVLAPARGRAQYRGPDEALTGAVVGGAVGEVLGGWQQRQRHHEERMERERWRQAHGDLAPDGPPRPGYEGRRPEWRGEPEEAFR